MDDFRIFLRVKEHRLGTKLGIDLIQTRTADASAMQCTSGKAFLPPI